MYKHKVTTINLILLMFLLAPSKNVQEVQIATPAATADTAITTTIAGCPVFPADNPWNQDVSKLPLDPHSNQIIASISRGGDEYLHADFGSDPEYGIPFVVVDGKQRKVPINFVEYGDESDPGPYPVPLDAPVEAGGDHHVLAVDKDNCILYELYHAERGDTGWNAGSGAIFDLRSDKLRPDGWTSVDAAGLPIFAGLAKYDEVKAGKITHALRFTVEETSGGFIHPATHQVSDDNDPNLPVMGMRLRLKASFDTSKFTGQSKVILEGLKQYGMIVADIGTSWFITGQTDSHWDDDDLDQLKSVPGNAFEVVQTGPIIRP